MRTQESLLCSQEPRAHDSFEETLVYWTRNLALPTLPWDPWPIFNELFPSWTLPVRQSLPIWCIETGFGETLLGCTSSPELEAWMVVVQGIHDGCRNGWVPGLHHRQTVRPTGPMCRGPCPRSVPETEPSEVPTPICRPASLCSRDCSNKSWTTRRGWQQTPQ